MAGSPAHAEAMLVERQLDRAWVLAIAADPEWIETDPRQPGVVMAFGRVPERGDRVLRVVYADGRNERRVISVFFDRRARKRTRETRP